MTMYTIHMKKLRLQANQNLLDLGCGLGRHLFTAAQHCSDDSLNLYGVDRSLDDLKTTKARSADFSAALPSANQLQLVKGDALNIPFANDFFDRVICSEVLEHIPDYQLAIKEIARVTKTGGHVGISVPHAWPERINWFISDDYKKDTGHIHLFNKGTLTAAFKQYGLHCYDHHYEHGFHSAYWWLKSTEWNRKTPSFLLRKYQQFLDWELIHGGKPLRRFEKAINPLLGKSLVLYFTKQ